MGAGDVNFTGPSTLAPAPRSLTLANNFIIASGVNATVNNTMTLTGIISESSPSGLLTKTGAGTLKLTGQQRLHRAHHRQRRHPAARRRRHDRLDRRADRRQCRAGLQSDRQPGRRNLISGTGSFTQAGTGNLTPLSGQHLHRRHGHRRRHAHDRQPPGPRRTAR
jgi:hypothetical protein